MSSNIAAPTTGGVGEGRQSVLESQDRDARRVSSSRRCSWPSCASRLQWAAAAQPVVSAPLRPGGLRSRLAALARRPAPPADAHARRVDGLPGGQAALRRDSGHRRRGRDPHPHHLGHDRPRTAARAGLAQGLGLDRRDVVLRDLGLRRAPGRHRLHRLRLRLVHRLLGPALRDGEDRRAQRARRRAEHRGARACRSATSAPPPSPRRRPTRCASPRRPSASASICAVRPVTRLILSGEPAGSIPQTKALIEEQWGAKAYDTAGMTEIGTIMVFECAHQPGGTHIIEDHVLEEVIDPDTLEPVALRRAGRARRHLVRARRACRSSATAPATSSAACPPPRARAGAALISTRAASRAVSTT